MPRSLTLAAVACVSLARPPRVLACATCSTGDPTLTAMGAEQPFQNRMRVSMELRQRVDTIGQGTGELRLSEQRLDLQMAWAPHERLFLMATVPTLHREVEYAGAFKRKSWGIGDVELRAKAFIYRDKAFAPRHLVGALAGVKLPTAPLERNSAGDLLPIEVQSGTGSVDPMLGLSYGFFAFPWSTYASAQVVIPTKGTNGFRASRSLLTTVALQRHLGEQVAVRLAADTRLDGKSIENDAEAGDSGGFIAFASPELLYSPVTDFTISVYARISVLNRLEGRHVEPYVVGGAVAYDF